MSERCFVGTRKGLFVLTRQREGWRVTGTHFLGAQVPMVLPGPVTLAALKHGHFGAKMHRSRDGGETWEEIAVPAFPPKPEGAEEVLDPMRQQPIPWSVELLWSLERGDTGRLWCGTIPGALFTSDDEGASWQLNQPLWDVPERSHWFGGGYDYPGIHSIAIDPRDAQTVTLGVSCGGVWKTTNGGDAWACKADGMRAAYMPPDRAFDPTIQDPHRVVQCHQEPDTFWAQHHNGIFKSTDSCETWTEHEARPSSFGFAACVHPTDGKTAWFVPAECDEDRYPTDGQFVVTRTRDGGQSFETLSAGLPGGPAYDLVFRHAMDVDTRGDRLVMGSTTGNLWVSEDQGDHWQSISHHLPPIYCTRFA